MWRIGIALWLVMVGVAAVGSLDAESADDVASACRAALAASPMPAPLRGLVYYQDFDHRGDCVCDGVWACRQHLDAFRLDAGRFGKGYRSERPRTNLLSPNQASVESGADGFTAGRGVALSSVEAKTRFGRRVLRAETAAPGAVFTLGPIAVKVKAPYRKTKGFCLSMYVRSDSPGAKVRLSLADTAQPPKDAKGLLPTKADARELALSAQWQRLAAFVELDVKRPEQQLVGTLELLSGAPAVIFADGLQLEQYGLYPHKNPEPTSWLPGGVKRAAGWVDLPVYLTEFSGQHGTLGCWVRNIPSECGAARSPSTYVSIGTRWYEPTWSLGGWTWYIGDAGKSKYKQSIVRDRGFTKRLGEQGRWRGWHMVAVTWGGKRITRYLDGEQFDEVEHYISASPSANATIRVGGSHLEWWTSESFIDEVFVFNRCLSADEIAALARRDRPLSADLPPVVLRRARMKFLRSEETATVDLEPSTYAGPSAEVMAAVPAMHAAVGGRAKAGQPLRLEIKPWLVEPGRYDLMLAVRAGGKTIAVNRSIRVHEVLPSRDYIIHTWSRPTDDTVELGFTGTMGAAGALERGLWGEVKLFKWSWDALDPKVKAACRQRAQSVAQAATAFPNVVACQVNTEISLGRTFRTDAAYLSWMEKEIGLKAVPEGVKPSPLRVVGRTDMPPDGLLTDDYPPYRFFQWWRERGAGCWLLNNYMVQCARDAGLHTVYYTDCPRVGIQTQFKPMDMVDHWAYPDTLGGVVAQISKASCTARLRGIPLRFTPGTIFWDDGSGLWVKDADGKRKVLCYGPAYLQEIFWLTVASPTTHMGLYGLIHRQRDMWNPAGTPAMRKTLHAIRPVGVLVGGLPAVQAPVAILDHAGLHFMKPEGKHPKDYGRWRHHWITRTVSRVTARTRVPFDWIGDLHVRAGWLDRYRVVIVPSAWCLPKDVHAALVAFAQRGGTVVADQVLRAPIPGAVLLPLTRQLPTQAEVEQHLGGWLRRYRDAHPGWLRVEPVESVYTTVREAGPARFVFVVNDHREPGPQYERFKITFNVGGRQEPLRDRGLPVDVTVNVPAGGAVYDVERHERVATQAAGDRQTFTAHLPAAWAGVYAVLPRPIERVTVSAESSARPGSLMPLTFDILDDRGERVKGRELLEVAVTSPAGPWPGVARYHRVVDGRLVLPLRLPLSAAKGRWRVEVREWLSGQRLAHEFEVR